MKLGTRIKTARIAKGLKQEDLGDKVYKSRTLISQIERTHKGNKETLRAIEKVLGVSLFDDEQAVVSEPDTEYVKMNALVKQLQIEIEGLKKELAAKDKIIRLQEQIIEGEKPKDKK